MDVPRFGTSSSARVVELCTSVVSWHPRGTGPPEERSRRDGSSWRWECATSPTTPCHSTVASRGTSSTQLKTATLEWLVPSGSVRNQHHASSGLKKKKKKPQSLTTQDCHYSSPFPKRDENRVHRFPYSLHLLQQWDRGWPPLLTAWWTKRPSPHSPFIRPSSLC